MSLIAKVAARERAKDETEMNSLIERMPKRVREYVAKLHSDLERLKAELNPPATPTRVEIHHYMKPPQYLPDDSRIRFHLPAMQGYIEVTVGTDTIDVRTDGFGGLVVLPMASNSASLMVGRPNTVGR
ncbi:MAG: hypothetical protein WC986_14415 [Elusimicrobiota bacterium]|jgi:hypothetical protein